MTEGFTRRGMFGLGGAAASVGFVSMPSAGASLPSTDEILVNQAGYFSSGPKRVAVRSLGKGTRGEVIFDLLDSETRQVVTQVTLKVEGTENAALGVADFSAITSEGKFCLKSGQALSAPFEISRTPFDATQRALIRTLYLQRCGIALEDPETGLAHGPCHSEDAVGRRTSEPRNCTGGWHDAGDFGKYVATTSVVIGELLSLYEEAPERFPDHALGLPESGNGEPDLLSEMRVGLVWLLKMQRTYGAFERKVAGNEWPSMTALPEADVQVRFAYGVSTSDTAKAAAALAIAARVFEPHDAAIARQFLAAAHRAWKFLGGHPQAEAEEYPGDDNGSGRYLPAKGKDEGRDGPDRLWAALELYLASGKQDYHLYLKAHAEELSIWPASWSNPSLIGLMNFLRSEERLDVAEMRGQIRKQLLKRAEEYEKISRLSPWGAASQDFNWGSNRELGARGRVLATAYQITGQERFLVAATAQADYILGKNPFGLSFVTGIGANHVQNPHHRFDQAARLRGLKSVIPGLLVGGANQTARAEDLALMQGQERYRDHVTSWETNEFAIDYNAALLALLGRLEPHEDREPLGIIARIRRWFGF